ncbi:MAG TPA: CBS domain-containing protein [Candidatus Nanoarchaeia archaeon]|nr:CBS domain-containing protein [Candidatus Nanoarchaeia archaeon]
MNNSLSDIQHLRTKFHLNQKELANRAGVSQSLIAKIEAGKIDPSFTKAQQIFQALDQLREQEEVKAKQVMKTKVFFAQHSDPLKEVIKAMKSKGISQMPVLQKERVIGILSESTILNKIAQRPEKIHSLRAEDMMEESPPIVSPNTGMHTLLELLRSHSIVLVSEKGDIKGIISKSDLLERIE